jgi:hypothetical protein
MKAKLVTLNLLMVRGATDVPPVHVGSEARMVRSIPRRSASVHERFTVRGAPGRAVVSHALLEDDANALAERLREQRPALEAEIALFTPVMTATTGPVIGVAWEDPALTRDSF